MTEAEAILAGLVETWCSSGSKKQNAMAYAIVDNLRSKGVKAEVVERKTRIGTQNAVWRDREFENRRKVEPF